MNSYIGKDSEASKVLRYYLDNADYLTENELEKIRVNLADCYIAINKLDSANILIYRGLKTFKNKDAYRYYQYLGLSGYYNLKRRKYHNAINDLLQCKKYFLANDDTREKNYVLLYLGKSYIGLNEKKNAVKNFTQIDSIVQKTNYIVPEFREAYIYLIDYYKAEKDNEKQLYYIERFLKMDQILDSQFKYVSRELPRRYDTPKLIQEKEYITNELKHKKVIFYASFGTLSLILSLFIFLYYKSKKAEKQYRKIAQNLIQSVNENKTRRESEATKEVAPVDFKEQVIVEDKTNKTISEDIAQTILAELEKFENREQFLNKGITLGNLAKKIKTNSKYLSEIINTYKGRNFASYLNDLRINHAIKRLAEDKKFRSYKISSIADELGYNTEQSFTMAFKKRTGTPLSIYLKEIERLDPAN